MSEGEERRIEGKGGDWRRLKETEGDQKRGGEERRGDRKERRERRRVNWDQGETKTKQGNEEWKKELAP